MLFLLLSLAFQTATTAPAPPDPAVYLEFFRGTAGAVDVPTTGVLNGSTTPVVLPSISERLGITHEEAAVILRIAPLCVHEVTQLDVDSRALIFEARLQAADEKISDSTAAKLRELEARRTSIILGYVQQLKMALGADTFKRVDDYIRR